VGFLSFQVNNIIIIIINLLYHRKKENILEELKADPVEKN